MLKLLCFFVLGFWVGSLVGALVMSLILTCGAAPAEDDNRIFVDGKRYTGRKAAANDE